VISVVLTTLGFTFPNKFGISAAYAKLAYTGWALQRFLVYKRLALCKFYKVDEIRPYLERPVDRSRRADTV
jgi:hypothetical protein